ncbi:hypothetical protein MTO96_017317 [Rhipicephalus appendiculatus]
MIVRSACLSLRSAARQQLRRSRVPQIEEHAMPAERGTTEKEVGVRDGGDPNTDGVEIRVLGLWLEENGANRELVARLQKKVAAATHLVRRVAKKRRGLKEHDVAKLIHAYALSHIAYVAAYADWNRSETDEVSVAIRKAFKTALGVPPVHGNP